MEITDSLSAMSLPAETFSVFDGPQFGVRYGGVAFAAPEASTWAMMLIGFAGLVYGGYRRTPAGVRAPPDRRLRLRRTALEAVLLFGSIGVSKTVF